MCSIEGHHGRMAGYCLSNSKWISGSLRRYPFHYNAGLCYSPFQSSNCPVLLTFIDIPDFKWKHNTEVRRRFWDSKDPRWGQRRKLLQNFQIPNMLWWGEEKREKKTQRWGTPYSQAERYGWMPDSDSHLSTHSTPGAQLILSLLSFSPLGINVLKYLFIWMFVTLFWPSSSSVLHWVSSSKVSDSMPAGKLVSLERESALPITERKLTASFFCPGILIWGKQI